MCGIAGILSHQPVSNAAVRRMIDPLAHRGPDDQGVWIDPDGHVGFGHRRLAIVDLSPLGHQPMESTDGRYLLVYNGEIYNHMALRAELDAGGAGAWRGHSDTETLLAAIARWGLERALQKSVGMFALALWDRRERTLSLARDRFGEKPLYYGWVGGDFLFGSELKALRSHPRFDNDIDRRALSLYAARTYIPAPFSIYRDIYKLAPATIVTLPFDQALVRPDGPLQGTPYWSYREAVEHGLANPLDDEGEAIDQLEATLAAAIHGQSIADVPVGAFLSGGIDSSTVVALYQKYATQPVRTFSIGFEAARFNEADHAKAVAAFLGTVHHERYVTVAETRDVIPKLPTMYDEPFADSSQIPTHLVSAFAREQVTVAMSGDGGDEFFGGYTRHVAAPALWDRLRHVPQPLRKAAAAGLGWVPGAAWSALAGGRIPHFGAKIQKGLRVAAASNSLSDVYASFLDEWAFEPSPVLGAAGRGGSGLTLDDAPAGPDAVRMMYLDATSYLPDDILCKVDRAAMAVSLETRVPFLDHRVAALAARIPLSMKVRGSTGKHVLRELLFREAPKALFDRPKAGFAVPIGDWLRGPLRDWAEALLDQRRLREDGYFDAAQVADRWAQHLAGRRDSTPAIWSVLMFQAWRESAAERTP